MNLFIIALLPIFMLTGLGTSIVLTTDIIEQASRIQNQYEIDEQYREEDFEYNIEDYYSIEESL